MDYKKLFQERAEQGLEILSRQKPVTLEEAKEQVRLLKAHNPKIIRKQKS